MFIIFIIILTIVVLVLCARIVPQGSAYVVQRLGKFHTTWMEGIHFRIPIVDHVARVVLLKEQVADFAPQPVITKDNVTMQIDSVVYFKIVDPKLYAYGVENPVSAMENLTATTLRNIIGEMELDTTLTSREKINRDMLQTIDLATDAWGIKVTRVELKNINPPATIQESMEKQMKADREKRAAILTAEGKKQSMILEAEGNKESLVLNAQAEKEAMILAAEAQKEKEIREAEGRAQAILNVRQAMADGYKAMQQAGVGDTVVKLRSLEAFEKAADGQATKIIIPSEIQGLAGLVEGVKEASK